MAQQKLTIYQKLTKMFGQTPEQPLISQFSIDDKEIIKARSKEEFDFKKLQTQQSKYLKNMWERVDSEIYQQVMRYETSRIGSYADFEAMDAGTPEISAALNVFSEEATTLSEKGEMLGIYSDSKRIKTILHDLFYERLDITTSLPAWTRNTCKYGDNFVFLKIGKEGEGVVGCTQLPNLEIERRETDLSDYIKGAKSYQGTQPSRKKDLHFIWRDKNIEFNSWEMAHFRLLMDDKFLPYGSSILEKARRTWKQYIMSLDAMLTYRVIRAPERRVFKIFVGNMSDEDVEPYIQKIANKFRRQPIVDPKSGQIDLRYNNPLSVDTDFFIPVRNDTPGTVIDTLPGASNLDAISDIELIQNQLFAALQVPKAFLGFEDAVGEGKNLALQDVRFTRTINRIQQAMVQELNKIAIIHLYLLGFDDELNNFELRLNNPSSQADMMKLELWRERITLYQQCLTDPGNGFTVTSMTWAKKNILNMSNDEIISDLEQQKIEKVAAKELANIKGLKTHIFDNIDRIYTSPEIEEEGTEEAPQEGAGGMGGGGGGFGGGGGMDTGGGDIGGDELDTEIPGEGEPGAENAGELPGGEGEPGAEGEPTDETKPEEKLPESIKQKSKLLSEDINDMIDSIDKYLTDDSK